MSGFVFFFLAAVLIAAGLLFGVVSFMRRGPARLNIDKYRRKWLEIERMLRRDDANSYRLAVLEADKLLDSALKEGGVKGKTMGDRLKANRAAWTRRDAVWNAHKLRNRIVHETDVHLNYDDARRALAGFKRALKDAGAI